MQSTVSIPIINLLQETANAVKKSGVKQVGLLGTETTIKSKIYDKVLDGLQILTLEKPEQTETTKIIMNILAGRKNPEDRKKLLGLIQKLRNNGAKKVILGCTELPLLIKANDDVFDTLETLAKSVIERATQ